MIILHYFRLFIYTLPNSDTENTNMGGFHKKNKIKYTDLKHSLRNDDQQIQLYS